ncbi:rod shape-determining protein MreD [Lacticaseibacillus thailandensis]|uniref:rod shape-determining protein MreD n=1 Tax=Lacticaseibacillus thailandensis TaxID=381741 RepID=UPI0006CF6C53|nr:rod shape-determining protein MreD [Lacticaseibacillus thailandensis]
MDEKRFTRHWVAIVTVYLAVLLDGALSHVLGQWIMRPTYTGVPQLTLLSLVLVVIFVPQETWTMAIAIGAGLITDCFYTGILGVNTFIIPLIVFVVMQVRPIIPRKWLFVWAVCVIAETLQEVANYVVALMLGSTTASVGALISEHIAPGLTVNIILFAIIYYALSRLLVKLTQD